MRDTKQEVLHFWFEETSPQQWFQKNPDFDSLISERFYPTYVMARDGLCDSWRDDPAGCLALCIVLDQFPRNMFRDRAESFATDEKALLVAKHAVMRGFDQVMPALKRRFLYLPYEHAESLREQEICVALFEKIKEEDPLGYEYALRHLEVIRKFGRFPHRNAMIGRENTPDEDDYLAQPGAGF